MEPRKHAIVTGAASGLGRATSIALGRQGWHVAVADLNVAGSEETLSLVRAAGGDGQVERLDVTKAEEWVALRDRLQATWPSLDLLMNNAGVGVGGEIGKLPLDDWKWIIDINLYGAIYGCHALVEWLKSNPRGSHIVNIASMAGVVSAPGMAPYNVTKAGMISLSETLYGELKSHNVGVTAVCPSFFPTNIIVSGRFQSEGQKTMATRLMSKSGVTADDVAQLILRAIERRKLYVMVPFQAVVFWWLKRLFPRYLLNLVAREFDRETTRQQKRETASTP